MIAALLSLYLGATAGPLVDPGGTAYAFGSAANLNAVAVRDVRLRIEVAPGVILKPVDGTAWQCEQNGNVADCTAATIPSGGVAGFTVRADVPRETNGGHFKVSIALTSADDPAGERVEATLDVRHHIAVQSAADSGEGTLRAAIEAANRDCASMPDCAIDVDLLEPATIDLLSPLPTLNASAVTIAGNATISGAHLRSGNGLTVRATNAGYPGFRLSGFTIADFPENGIDYFGSGVAPAQVDIRQCTIERNGGRGVSINAANAAVDLHQSTVSHNARSGVALWEVQGASLFNNTIEWNGASGIYVGATHGWVMAAGGQIAFNDIGVAIDPAAVNTSVIGVAMDANIAGDLDWGLDGNNAPEVESGPPIPILLSATYDAETNTTRVSGELRGKTFGNVSILFYASDHVNRWGVTPMTNMAELPYSYVRTNSVDGFTPFTLPLPGDYRGAFLSAQTAIATFPDYPVTITSELSRAVLVGK